MAGALDSCNLDNDIKESSEALSSASEGKLPCSPRSLLSPTEQLDMMAVRIQERVTIGLHCNLHYMFEGQEVQDMRLFTAAAIATAVSAHPQGAFRGRNFGLNPVSQDLGHHVLDNYLSKLPGALESEISRLYIKLWNALPVPDEESKESVEVLVFVPQFPSYPVLPSSALGLACRYVLDESLISEKWWQWLDERRGGFSFAVNTREDMGVQQTALQATEPEKRAIWLALVFANVMDVMPFSSGLVSLAENSPHEGRRLCARLENVRRRTPMDTWDPSRDETSAIIRHA